VSTRRRGRLAVHLLLAAAVTASGCRSTGVQVADFLAWGSRSFAPNPVATGPFHAGMAVGFVVALPLCLISWPLAALLYPDEDEDEYFLSSALAPSLLVGTLVGTLAAAPVAPLGFPFLPDEPPPPDGPPLQPGPAPEDEAGGPR